MGLLFVGLYHGFKFLFVPNIGALIIRTGPPNKFCGILHHNYIKEPRNSILIIKAPTLLVNCKLSLSVKCRRVRPP